MTTSRRGHALGVHYTLEPLVIEVVLGALEPAFAGAWVRADRQPERYREELLGLRVLDPAMGCAHFLTVVALEIARELASVELHGQPLEPDAFEVWPEADKPGVERHHDPWTRLQVEDVGGDSMCSELVRNEPHSLVEITVTSCRRIES